MTDEESELIRTTILDVLLREDMRSVAYPQSRKDQTPPGIWGQIGDEFVYFGSNFPVALFTANHGDWWIPERDGPVTPEDVAWFDLRITLGREWKALQTRSQFTESRRRIFYNYQPEDD